MKYKLSAGVVLSVLLLTSSLAIAGQSDEKLLGHAGAVSVGDKLSLLKRKGVWKASGLPGDSDAVDCDYYQGKLLSVGVSMMVENDVVVRFDMGNDQGIGPFGVKLGDTEASALEKMPHQTIVGPDTYGTNADHYLTWRYAPKGLAFRVETHACKVTGMYWGRWKAVQYVEGCL